MTERVRLYCRNITVEPVLVFFMFASYLTFSAFMSLTYDKSCLALYNQTLCDALRNEDFAKNHTALQDAVETESSYWILINEIAMNVPATLSLLLWMGSCGDRVGRRLPLVVPCAGAVIYSICNLVNSKYMAASPALLVIGPVFSGLSGSYLAVMMAAYTYLTHLADPATCMMRVGLAEAAIYLAATVSAFASDRMVDTLGYVPVFALALSCQAIALAYAVFILPDIKPTQTGEELAEPRNACCVNPVRDMWTFLTTPRDRRKKLHLVLFIIVLGILQLCTTGESDVLLLYPKREPFNWSYTKYGYFSGANSATRCAAVLLLLPLLKKLTSLRDTVLILAGLISRIIGLIILGAAKQEWLIFLVVAVGALQGFPSAGLRSSMAGLVEKDEQGRMFALVAATEGIASSLATWLFNDLWPLTLKLYDGLCFHLAAALTIVCFVIVLWQHKNLTTGYVPLQDPRDNQTLLTEDDA